MQKMFGWLCNLVKNSYAIIKNIYEHSKNLKFLYVDCEQTISTYKKVKNELRGLLETAQGDFFFIRNPKLPDEINAKNDKFLDAIYELQRKCINCTHVDQNRVNTLKTESEKIADEVKRIFNRQESSKTPLSISDLRMTLLIFDMLDRIIGNIYKNDNTRN